MGLPLRGRVVVLTGAASGIGAALATLLASEGAVLALVDRNESALAQVATALRGSGTARTFALDLTDRGAVSEMACTVQRELGDAAVLINNAGIALGGRFEQVSAEQFDRVLEVNFAATVNMTRAFLPQLHRSAPAQIVNLSSIFGIVGVPGQVAYCASKFAVRGFSEALRLELASYDVGITVVHPGGVRTGIARHSDVGPGVSAEQRASMQRTAEKLLRMSPETAARHILRALRRRSKRVVIGADAHLLTAMQRMLPASYGTLFPKS